MKEPAIYLENEHFSENSFLKFFVAKNKKKNIMSDYCGACYCNAKCEKKHIKCFERKLDKYNNKEARKKMIQSDARQALKDAEKVRNKPAKDWIQNLFLQILKKLIFRPN